MKYYFAAVQPRNPADNGNNWPLLQNWKHRWKSTTYGRVESSNRSENDILRLQTADSASKNSR